jgi:hypothetical protein
VSIRQALRTAAMGEAAASRSVHRLLATGLLRIAPPMSELEPQRKTDPYGFMPALENWRRAPVTKPVPWWQAGGKRGLTGTSPRP